MLYEQSKGKNKELFLHPTSEYRGAPFWAWNCALDEKETLWQTDMFKEMGFGGYHMHVRTGLETPYLGEEFNRVLKACVKKSYESDMLAWLYDEDRWPSGFAGGLVTKDRRYAQRYLLFTTTEQNDPPVTDGGRLTDGKKLLARYEIRRRCGQLLSYKRLRDGEEGKKVWYAYLCLAESETWYNNERYVDTMCKEAMDKFAEITYGTYRKNIGEYIDNTKTVPAIFTDEPQIYRETGNANPFAKAYKRAWTDDFAQTYEATYGEDVLDFLPELFFEKKTGYSVARYRFYDHLAERFAEAFSDNLGKHCEEAGLRLTGHLMEEPTLYSQIQSLGEAMRQYRGFQLPGIDMLCSRYELTTAKQAQSAVHQYNREGMLSELYGVSRWNYDFRLYKLHGDWQAALGVTVRVPHLSMMSMKGEAKRDYPASIAYQSPWYQKYSLVEDHFARVNTAMTGGRPLTDIAVLHPVESYWLLFGQNLPTMKERIPLEKKFKQITEWLLRAGLDFDYISESLLPSLCPQGGCPLTVGAMRYKAIVVPGCLTLRESTVERLERFVAEGGRLIFAGGVPELMNAVPTRRPTDLARQSVCLPFDREKIVNALEDFRYVGFYDKDGKHTDRYIAGLRERDGGRWLFVARANKESFPDHDSQGSETLTVKMRGKWVPSVWNTVDGTIHALPYCFEYGYTIVRKEMFDQDSLLLRYDTEEEGLPLLPNAPKYEQPIVPNEESEYELSEPNVFLLDRARYAMDNDRYSLLPCEILAADNICRKKAGYPKHGGSICQPWAAEKKEAVRTISLRFDIPSEIEYDRPYLAMEDAEKARIFFNKREVDKVIDGWYVDKSIHKVQLPPLKKGINVLEIVLPFGENTDTEWCYLLGNFGVSVRGNLRKIVALPKKVRFGDLTKQGFPHYGGKFVYHTSFEGNGKDAEICLSSFRAPVAEVSACGVTKPIAYAPYSAVLPTNDGYTPLDITVYASRQNAFGCVHNPVTKAKNGCIGPSNYRLPRNLTFLNYILMPEGVLTAPTIKRGKE